MSLFDKARELSEKVTDKALEFSGDELIADTIIKAVEKQESVNAVLKNKGALYRVSDIELQMGIPPTVSFGIRRIDESDKLETEISSTTNNTST